MISVELYAKLEWAYEKLRAYPYISNTLNDVDIVMSEDEGTEMTNIIIALVDIIESQRVQK